MAIPTAVFLDTCVLEGQSFNFSSVALSTFAEASKKHDLRLLLPDPTKREIWRHMAVRSEQALKLLDEAHRTAPFLQELKGFPPRESPRREVERVRGAAWGAFLRQFEVVRLDYDGIRLTDVMNWYDSQIPPFGKGKKEKEFPDAFAIAILIAYAEKNGCYIAVVSQDADLMKACARFPSLMHFESLPVLTELLLSAEDGRLAVFKGVLEGAKEKLADAAYKEARDLSFYHHSRYSHIDDSEVTDLSIADVRIVALGQHQCTIAFDAVIKVNHWVEWMHGTERHEPRYRDVVESEYDVSGTAKVFFEATSNALVGIPYLDLNEGEIEATGIPPY
jgi:hypothetical protein